MSRQVADGVSRLGVPEMNRAVVAGRRHHLAVRRPGNPADLGTRVRSRQRQQETPGRNVPYLRIAPPRHRQSARGGKTLAVGAKSKIPQRSLVSPERQLHHAGNGIANPHVASVVARGQPPAVPAIGEADDREPARSAAEVNLLAKPLYYFSRRTIPDTQKAA